MFQNKPKLQLTIVFIITLVISSLTSHIIVRWLKIKSAAVFYRHYGSSKQDVVKFVHGSSLAFDGLNWDLIAEELDFRIENASSLGSSPVEWEVLHRLSAETRGGFIVVSAYDLNEHWLSDFRADIVPLTQTVSDLWGSSADWELSERTLRQYPIAAVRLVFPTVGRSDGVMVGLRAQIQKIISNANAQDVTKGKHFSRPELQEHVSDWQEGRLLRRLALLRAACKGKHSFDGPKKRALARLVELTVNKEFTILVVLPVPPIYQQEFLTADVLQQFDSSLSELQMSNPNLKIVRIDKHKDLLDNKFFYDLMHLNMYGQAIATDLFLRQVKPLYKP